MSSKPNRDQLNAAFDILVPSLRTYAVPVIRKGIGNTWWTDGVYYQVSTLTREKLPKSGDEHDLDLLDLAAWLQVVDMNWNDHFKAKLPRQCRTWIIELKDARIAVSHLGAADLDDDDTDRYLDTVRRVLAAIDAPAAAKVKEIRDGRKATTAPVTATVAQTVTETVAKPQTQELSGLHSTKTGLLAWRDVIDPHQDVRKGNFQVAEFAADLAQVLSGRATTEYADADEFFDRTFLTEGMRLLLGNAVRRLTGTDGDPVVQLKTAFGGGKTHSMLSLYHLAKEGPDAFNLNGLATVFEENGITKETLPYCQVAVLVGTDLESSKSWMSRSKDKIEVRTLWGEMAAQLAGEQGYELVRSNDQIGVAPGGSTLIELFDLAGPCVILIDELVAYARNIYAPSKDDKGEPNTHFGAVMSFIQALTEAVKSSPQTLVVVSIPESDSEMGGDVGRHTRNEIELVLGRTESVWKQANAQEGFEIVRRRLFRDVSNPEAMEATIQTFTKMYAANPADFPADAREARYRDRMRASYPIHPEFFDRLYGEWSTLPGFQRTRGVLRLMAHVIHAMYEANDQAPMIMPGALPLDQPKLRDELTKHLPENWTPIIDQDIDGDGSTPYRIEANNQTLHKMQAARRVTRAIFLASAPGQESDVRRGADISQIKLGAALPKDVLGNFDSAISRLTAESRYLYGSDNRYWYDTKPNLNREAADRAQRYEEYEVAAKIDEAVKTLVKNRGGFRAVHPTGNGADVPDEDTVRLVVLPYSAAYKKAQGNASDAIKSAATILANRGNSPRTHKNMLIFLAADADAVKAMTDAARKLLAWSTIVADEKVGKINLDGYGRATANAQLAEAEKALPGRIGDAYKWVISPEQTEGTGPWTFRAEPRNGGSGDSLAQTVFSKLEKDGTVITKWSPAVLKIELDRWFFDKAPHVSTKRLWETLSTYGYVPRLATSDVLDEAMNEGVTSTDFFGYAARVSAEGRYEGLKFGERASAIIDPFSVLVRPDAAQAQIDEDERARIEREGKNGGGNPPVIGPGPNPPVPPVLPPIQPPVQRVFQQYVGTARIDTKRPIPHFSEIVQDVIQHLTGVVGADVTVRVEIQADLPTGFNEQTRRTVSENGRQLKFENNGFE